MSAPINTREFTLQLVDAWNAHDEDRVATFYAPTYSGMDIGEAQPHWGPDGIRAMYMRYLQAFPDLLFTVESTITEGNRIAFTWTAEGTHLGPLMNIPPSSRPFSIRGVSVLTIEDGHVTDGMYVWDVAGFLRSIGLLPEL